MLRWMAVGFALTLVAGSAHADSAGKATYDKMCASCHGADGRGNAAKARVLKIDPKLLDLGREEARSIPREAKRKILLEGKAKMPAYAKKLKADQVDPVLDHSLGLVGAPRPEAPGAPSAPGTPPVPAPPAAAPPGLAAPASDETEAKALWKKSCAGCHGQDGRGMAAKAKALKIDVATLNLGREAAASLSRDEKRAIIADGEGKMPAYAKKLKPAQIDLLTEHSDRLARAIREE
jgi:mono/diheme cytochrome c family protein